jgi:hypothetical protein
VVGRHQLAEYRRDPDLAKGQTALRILTQRLDAQLERLQVVVVLVLRKHLLEEHVLQQQ